MGDCWICPSAAHGVDADDGLGHKAYVGFYWTLSVPLRVKRAPPRDDDVETAARLSRTIRYQRELTRRLITARKGVCVGEYAFFDVEPDRATELVEATLEKVVGRCIEHNAKLITVDFEDRFKWRPHHFMDSYLLEHEVDRDPQPPDPIRIDGEEFDPVRHFRRWRRRHEAEAVALRDTARAEATWAVRALSGTANRYEVAAERLNARRISSTNGKDWTGESVRQTFRRYGSRVPDRAEPSDLITPAQPIE